MNKNEKLVEREMVQISRAAVLLGEWRAFRVYSYVRQVVVVVFALLCWLNPEFSENSGRRTISLPVAWADNVQYSYDQLGRITKAANTTSGQSVIYTYDPAGNIASTNVVPNGAVSISGFSPNQGLTGTQVTIIGTGFDATATNNVVSFNGTAASVSSASATQLIVSVPSSALTGPITVTNSGGAGTSAGSFVVNAGGSIPTVTSFSPTVATQGSTINIQGTNFSTDIASDNVAVNQYAATVSAATTTSITATLSASATSGKVQVTTVNGTAVSANDLIVVPMTYGASNVGTSGRIPTNSTPATVSILTPNKIAVELFDGVVGQYLTVGISSNTIANATLTVYGPNGAQVLTAPISSSTTAIQLPRLLIAGTYSVIIDPGANSGSLTLTVRPALAGTMTVGGGSQVVQITNPGQRAVYSFSANAGDFISLTQTSTALNGNLTIFDPNGIPIITGSTDATTILRPMLPVTGTYTILVDPQGAVSGNDTLKLTSGPTPSFRFENQNSYTSDVPFGFTVNPNDPWSFYFSAAAGDDITLASLINGGIMASLNIQVYSPNSTFIESVNMPIHPVVTTCTGSNCLTEGSIALNLGLAPYSGAYKVTMTQNNARANEEVDFQLSRPMSSSISTDSTVTPVIVSKGGQSMLLSFVVDAKKSFILTVSESNSGIKEAAINLFSPQGVVLKSGSLTTNEALSCNISVCSHTNKFTGSTTLDTGMLPIGQYQIRISQIYLGAGTLSFSLTPQ